MKAFNKLFSLVVASVLVFSLAGCGDKEESKKFSANLNGTESLPKPEPSGQNLTN